MTEALFNASFKSGSREYRYVDLKRAFGEATVQRMPLSLRIFAENILRCAGPPDREAALVEGEIATRGLDVAAVLSGNRNFEGRIHPLVRDAFLGSPPLVVAYALAGSMRLDIQRDPLGRDAGGRDVYLRDIWPSDAEIDEVVRQHVQPKQFESVYRTLFEPAEPSRNGSPATPLFGWREASTYVRRPPYWDGGRAQPARLQRMRALVILGDNITTDHISPAGAIAAESDAGKFLTGCGVAVQDFNAYGARRANHDVMISTGFTRTFYRSSKRLTAHRASRLRGSS